MTSVDIRSIPACGHRADTRTMAQRLNDATIRRLPPPGSGNRITYDDAVAGFGIRVTAQGARAFVLNYRRKADGRERRITIGAFPAWSSTAARTEAARL